MGDFFYLEKGRCWVQTEIGMQSDNPVAFFF